MDSPHDEERRRHMIHRQQHGRNEHRAQNTGLGKAKQRDTARGHLHRCHVVEGMVQLLANGFVLELLSIQFIWRSEVDRKFKQVPRTAGAQEAGGEARGRWRRRREGGRRRQTLVRVLKDCVDNRETNIWFSLRLPGGLGARKTVWQSCESAPTLHRTLPTHKHVG